MEPHPLDREPIVRAAGANRVDLLGPEDAPPAEITVKTTKELAAPEIPKIETRVWLTWDRAR